MSHGAKIMKFLGYPLGRSGKGFFQTPLWVCPLAYVSVGHMIFICL